MARKATMTYNPETGKWSKNVLITAEIPESEKPKKESGSSSAPSSDSGKNSGTSSKATSSNLTSSTPSVESSEGATEKKYNEIEVNTLSGTLQFIATNVTIKLRAGDTVKLKGLGKSLSGNYYVKEVTRQIGNDGYSHSALLIRTDFGDKLKLESSGGTPAPAEQVPSPKPATTEPTKEPAQRTYTVKRGDCLWNIAKKYYGNGASYTKIYEANTGKIANPNLIYPGQVFVIP